jgi:hypothetical protein
LSLTNQTFLDGSIIIAFVSILFFILIVPHVVSCCEGWYQKCVTYNFLQRKQPTF